MKSIFPSNISLVVLMALVLTAFSGTVVSVESAGIAVSLGDVTDSRSSGQFFKQLRVEIVLSGAAVNNAEGMIPPRIIEARSNLGNSLIDDRFQGVDSKISNFSSRENIGNSTVDLKNPLRNAESVNIKGFAQLYVPSGSDSEKLVIENYLEASAQEVDSPKLISRNIKLIYLTKDDMLDLNKKTEEARNLASESNGDIGEELGKVMSESLVSMFENAFGFGDSSDLTFRVEDPNDHIIRIDLVSASGELIKRSSSTASQSGRGPASYGYDFERMLPPKGKIIIYFADEKNLIDVPFDLDVTLP